MIVAHRGASRHAPENTLPAFDLAWRDGADAVEVDVHLTRDGQVVCVHDERTRSVSDTDLVIRDTTLAELRRLDVGARYDEKYRGTCIPTIDEVLSTVPGLKQIYIEIKCGVEVIPRLLEAVRSSGLKDEQVVPISFDTNVIRGIKVNAPQYKALWLSSFERDECGKIAPSPEAVLDTLRRTGADGVDASKDCINEPFIRSIMNHGYEYHVWTVDELDDAMRFRQWGAASITTNVPGHMKRNLVEAGVARGGSPRR